jgi:peptidoglycan-N-acetylglucosamine deacetylase
LKPAVRRGLIAAGVVIVATAATLFALYHVSRARCFALNGPVICRVETSEPKVALTFDDGPTEIGVDAILPLLDQHDAQATFFLIGQEIARRPDLAQRLVGAGHEIANHSFSHRQMVARSAGFYDHELARTEAVLRQAGGTSDLFRPPYGKKLFGLPREVKRQQLRMVLWDVEDPQTSDPKAFADQVVAAARPGSIILIHAMYPANATARQALPRILQGLKAKGLQVVSVQTLLAGQR